ncbi:general transcriptional corepressor trfA-like isoform X2 [Pogonomyrmex barbatus]|nr:general transcriptional corepressor trfA-like isoform X2 [Pogonomyrmex barbatus]XP_011637865.1 general transcriptional corepressor trfA-like isoform X2 [Pogonomyrmex barbatus]XP_011637866.1 general transcriptional corepressor trfA-like isoform X2 [Pogonomyrmex barbatus]XP_011637867.1 general transcriptional corepressor trfA-like isoform X2 [Pogonomyrmex barbatus]
MDDVNINNICLVEETEVVGDEQEWIKLSWISDQSDNNGDLQSPESTENMEKNMDDEVVQTKNYDKGSYTNIEPEDISDGISVITESDTDVINTNSSEVCQFNSKPYKSLQMVEAQRNKWNISYLELNTFVLGLILGLMLGYFFMIPETCPISNTINTKNLEIASHNIVNTCKGLKEVKSILNEIKAYIPLDKKITKQFLEITNSSNETNETKPIVIIKESFNFTVYPLDQLQESLYILSSLTIYDDGNSSLKNEINKTLNIMNNVKEFYDKLKLMNNNTEDISNSIVLNFLQHDSENIRNISKSLLSNLIEKASKVTSKIYNKYNKERYKLNKKMCHLKNILADDKILKQLTESNQLFKDYNTSCFSNYMSENFDGKATIKKNTKTNDIKKQIGKTDDSTMHTKYNKDIHKIYDNRHNSFKNKDKQNKFTFNMDRFLQNANNKIYNTSQFFLSKIAEKINILKYELNKKVHNLKDMLSDCNKFLEQLIEDNKEEKISVKHRKGKSDYLQSTVLSENDISKDNFDILTQLKNMFPLSSNYCSQFNINMTTLDTASNYKKKNYKHKKRDTTSKKAASNHANSAQILLAEEKNRPKKKDYSKSNGSTKKVFDDKVNNEKKHVSSHIKMKNPVSKDTVNYQKSKHSSFDSRKILKQNDQFYMYTDRKSDVEKSHEDKKQRHGASDWYFQRVYSRRNARRRAKYQYITIGYRR